MALALRNAGELARYAQYPQMRWYAPPRRRRDPFGPIDPINAASIAFEKGQEAVRYMQRKFRNRRRKNKLEERRKKVGFTPGEDNTQRTVSTTSNASVRLNTHQLYSHMIELPGQGVNINERSRGIINLRGIKICIEFMKAFVGAIAPPAPLGEESNFSNVVYVNVALISPTDNKTISTIPTEDLFRSNGPERAASFQQLQDHGIRLHCTPINSDMYHVWMHKRFRLYGDTSSPGVHHTVMKYVPINRQIRFDVNTPSDKFFLVYWLSLPGYHEVQYSPVATCNWHHVTYYKETCTC